jgi:hypothetical protein
MSENEKIFLLAGNVRNKGVSDGPISPFSNLFSFLTIRLLSLRNAVGVIALYSCALPFIAGDNCLCRCLAGASDLASREVWEDSEIAKIGLIRKSRAQQF